MSMIHDSEMSKGVNGIKRSSWRKIHFRDLALRICQQHSDATVEELATALIDELEKAPEYLDSIAVYIMANVRASLSRPQPRNPKPPSASKTVLKSRVLKNVASKVAAHVLMDLQLPSGKPLRHSTGAECIKAGGWFRTVGEAVGRQGIVGEKLTENDLQKYLKQKS